MSPNPKPEKTIFVIMPFRQANSRKSDDLSYFFENHLKKPIERHEKFNCQYTVKRSDTEFSITDGIISDIVRADIVICDLSGPFSNANVMYELGIRLSVSTAPVILIREETDDNKSIFDISGLYQQPYSMGRIAALEEHLIKKIDAFETGRENFHSPILKSINATSTYWSAIPRNKACAFLGGLSLAAEAALKVFGAQVQSYALERDKTITPQPPNEVYRILQEIKDSALLEEFQFSFSRLPALDNYLSSIYLMGLINNDLEHEFRMFLIAYSINFLSNTTPYVQGNKTLLFTAYAAESLILINLCRSLIKLLQARDNSTEAEEARQRFQQNAQKSNILKGING